jgi:hypothetical protein
MDTNHQTTLGFLLRHIVVRFFCAPSLVFWFLLSPSSLSAAPKKDQIPAVETSVIYEPTVRVLRGGSCEVTLRAISPQGYEVKFEITKQPGSGKLSTGQRTSPGSISYIYTHDGTKNASQDSFRFKSKSGPKKAWGYGKAMIYVDEIPARLVTDVTQLDFGSVFLGDARTLPVQIRNTGGALLEGRLKISPPWTLEGSADFALAQGEAKEFLITFQPRSADTQRGTLVMETGVKPFSEILLQGVGERRFQVPEKAAFEQHVGANQLVIPVKNLTAAVLEITVDCQHPLRAPHSLTLQPGSLGELVLELPSKPFDEKNALVTLDDGWAKQEVRIQLPPPPSKLEWEIEGKNFLGTVTPGRTVPLVAKLRNTGSGTATATLRLTGSGIALAVGQPSLHKVPSGENVTIEATWTFPEKAGLAQATLVAESEGLPPIEDAWEADIHIPIAPAPSPKPLTPAAAASSTAGHPEVFSPSESARSPAFYPHDPAYRLEIDVNWSVFFQKSRTATAIISWQYDGPEPVEFFVQREIEQRKGFFDKTVPDRSISTVEKLPQGTVQFVWTNLDPETAKITKLSDGRWQAQIPGLSSGYREIRVIAKQSDATRVVGLYFNVFVGLIPLPSPFSWTLPILLCVCTAYLLRKKIRSLFGK